MRAVWIEEAPPVMPAGVYPDAGGAGDMLSYLRVSVTSNPDLVAAEISAILLPSDAEGLAEPRRPAAEQSGLVSPGEVPVSSHHLNTLKWLNCPQQDGMSDPFCLRDNV